MDPRHPRVGVGRSGAQDKRVGVGVGVGVESRAPTFNIEIFEMSHHLARICSVNLAKAGISSVLGVI